MKDMLVGISGLFGKRFTDRQKVRFIHYMKNHAEETKVRFVPDSGRIGRRVCRNIYLGNLKRAKILLVTPYDTPGRILWPGIRYYPVNARKNAVQDSIAKALDFLLAIVPALAYYLFVFRTFSGSEGPIGILTVLVMILLTLTGAKIIYGWGNRNNYARNSASIVIALECLRRFGPDRVSVALLDQSCCGFGGYEQLAGYLSGKGPHKKVIVLDCVTSGQEFHLHYYKKTFDADQVESHQIKSHQVEGGDQKQSVIGLFPDSLILTGGSRVKEETVIADTRCRKDCRIDLDKMEAAVDIICDLADRWSGSAVNGPHQQILI